MNENDLVFRLTHNSTFFAGHILRHEDIQHVNFHNGDSIVDSIHNHGIGGYVREVGYLQESCDDARQDEEEQKSGGSCIVA